MRDKALTELANHTWLLDSPSGTPEQIIDDILRIIVTESAYGGGNSESDFTYFWTKEWLPIRDRIMTLKGKK